MFLISKNFGIDKIFNIQRTSLISKLKMSLFFLKNIKEFNNYIDNIKNNLEKVDDFLFSEVNVMVLVDYSKTDYKTFCNNLKDFILDLDLKIDNFN